MHLFKTFFQTKGTRGDKKKLTHCVHGNTKKVKDQLKTEIMQSQIVNAQKNLRESYNKYQHIFKKVLPVCHEQFHSYK